MAGFNIKTPMSTIFSSSNTNGGKLEWNANFGSKRTKQFENAQKFVDSEVLRLCSPRVPFDTGALEHSGTLGTKIGSGEVCYNAVYARYQYYNTSETRPYDHNRGAKWFERMKNADMKTIEDGAAKYFE
ncbi:MAG: minor capsid protein [Bacteroidales bacterium]|nr:minor capsid protein [Bacteroidales bacterium]